MRGQLSEEFCREVESRVSWKRIIDVLYEHNVILPGKVVCPACRCEKLSIRELQRGEKLYCTFAIERRFISKIEFVKSLIQLDDWESSLEQLVDFFERASNRTLAYGMCPAIILDP